MTWPTKKLGELINIHYGKGLPKSERTNEGVYWAYGSNGPVYATDRFLTNGPTIVIGRKGATGAVHLVNDPCWPIDTTFYVEIEQKDEILLNFLYFLFQTMKLDNLAIVTAVPGINRDVLYNLRIPVPPISVQRGIVERLDAIRKAQELNDKQIKLADELFKSMLHKEFQESEKWQKTRMAEVADDIITGKTPPTGDDTLFEPEISWATPVDFKEHDPWIDDTNRKISKLAIQKGLAPLIPARALMIVCIGATIGKIGLSRNEMSTNQQVNSVIFDESSVLPEFAYYYFARNRNLIIKHAKITTLPILNKNLTGKVIIRVPSTETQHRIAQKLQAVQDYKKSLLAQKGKLKELFESTLDKAMRGG